MITFENWELRAQGGLAHQYDNLTRRLEVLGDLPDGWDWTMLVQVDDHMDLIPLSPMEGGIGTDLSREQLALAGIYQLQLRGSQGDRVRHTNTEYVQVFHSLSGDSNWPEIPSAFTQLEQRIQKINNHPPVPGENGFWLVWDVESEEYTESEYPLPHGSNSGSAGTDGGYYLPSVDETTGLLTFIPSQSDMPSVAAANVRGPQGEPGPSGADGAGMDLNGAAVGQVAQIAAVDETGTPTQWIPAYLPNGSAEQKWRLIRSITLEEDIKTLTVDVDDNGDPFEITQFVLKTNAVNSAEQTGATTLLIKPNEKNYAPSNNAAIKLPCGANGATGRAWLYAHSLNPVLIFVGPWATTSSSDSKAMQTVVDPLVDNPFTFGELITSFTIAGQNSSHYIGTGSTIEIYGR